MLLAAVLFFHLAIHVRYLGLPPTGFHTWRQADGYSVARNFDEESMNILEPRVDYRGAGTGIVGMEFPLVPWLVAAVERTIGPHAATARSVVLVLSVVAVVGCYAFTKQLTGSPMLGAVGALLLVVSPLFAYYSVTVRELESMMIQGARYLISDSRELENRPEIAERLLELGRQGRFRVFRLKGSRW